MLERLPNSDIKRAWMHTKSLYRLTDDSMTALRGCTTEMCSTSILPRNGGPKVSTRLL